MAVEDFGGSVDGAPIEVLSADHQKKPDVGSNIVREWIDVQDVDVIVDVPTSSVALAVAEIVKEKDRVFLVSGAATTELTGAACSPNTIHWTYDTYALAVGTGRAMVQEGGDLWFFITADYAFGHQLEADTAAVVEADGGQVLGSVRHPLSSSDFSSYLLQAQGSGAKVIGLANAGTDTTNAIKQAHEFGITQAGQQLASLLMFLTDINALGLDVAQGIVLTTGFYWDMNEETRAWSERFNERAGRCRPWCRPACIRGHPLSERDPAGGQRSGQGGGRPDEGDAGQRFLRQGGRSGRTAAWCTTCTWRRSRRRRNPRVAGTT